MIWTQGGDFFTAEDQINLARLIFIRFDRNTSAATRAWNRLFMADCSESMFMNLMNDTLWPDRKLRSPGQEERPLVSLDRTKENS